MTIKHNLIISDFDDKSKFSLMMAGGGPRRPHPPPSQPAVARVTPMVPEVSLFFPSQTKPRPSPQMWQLGEPRGRVPLDGFSGNNQASNPGNNGFLGNPSNPSLQSQRNFDNPSNTGPRMFNNSSNSAPRTFNNLNPQRRPLNLPSNPSPTPSAVNSPVPAPAPHRAPTPTQFKPQSDFSRMFAGGLDMTCLVPGETGSGGVPKRHRDVQQRFMEANGSTDDTQTFNLMEKLVGEESQDRGLGRGDSRDSLREKSEDLKSQYNFEQKKDQEVVLHHQRLNEEHKAFNNVRNVNKNVQFTPNGRDDGRNAAMSVNQNLQFTPNPNSTGDSSNAMTYRMPELNLPNQNENIRTQSSATQSSPDLTSPSRTHLTSHSQLNLVLQPNQPSPLPPDLIQVLSWQNDQLRQLQKQVEILLQSPARHQESPSITPTQTPKSTCTASTMTSMVWPDLEAAMAKLAAATDTPEHPIVENLNSSSLETSPQPSLHLDLPDYTPSEVSPPDAGGGRRGKAMVDMKDIDSPVLGESVSMYESIGEADNPQELYNNILGQVRRMLDVDGDPLSPIAEQSSTTTSTQPSSNQICPSSKSQPSSNQTLQSSRSQPSSNQTLQSSRSQNDVPAPQLPPTTPVVLNGPSPPPPTVDPALATLERLRSLGISFISPADLTPAVVQSAQDGGNKYNSVYLPTAASPSMSVFQGASPDTSLDINSLALKYLDDSQLTKLAEKHGGAEHKEKLNRPEKEDGGNNFSMATHQFLNRYGLGGQANAEKYNASSPTNRKPIRNVHLDAIQETGRGRNGYMDAIQETETALNFRDRQLANQSPAPHGFQQNQVNQMQISPQGNQGQRPQQHRDYPRQQQVQPQSQNLHRYQQQSPHFQHPQPSPMHQQQTPRLLPQQVLQLQQGGSHPHQRSPRPHHQIPVHLQPGSNVNIPNRILDITAIRQQPKLL